MAAFTINDLTIGLKKSFTKTITETDVYLFAGISGDINPAHINEEYAKETSFKHRIAHGILSSGLISAVLGVHLPGPGTIYISQSLNFLAPVYIGDTVTATVEVKEIIKDRNKAVLITYCTNQEGITVIKGEAVVLPPKVSYL